MTLSVLVGDIGGTHSRFGLVTGKALTPTRVEVEDDDAHEDFESAVAAYLEKAGEKPERAVFALAGPVSGRSMTLTNRSWEIDADALEKRFGFERVELVNDFVAQAASLPHIPADELTPIGSVEPRGDAAKVALGPGTGLGVAGLAYDDGRWIPLPSEGGHVELAATDEREAAAFAVIRKEKSRVEAEDLLSGPGMVRLHRALALASGRSGETLSTPELVERASNGDATALETVELFLTMLARFAGDVALTFGAQGGVYLCGGVAPRLTAFLDQEAFRAAFEAKRPHEALMRRTATLIVTSAAPGLLGCAAIARNKMNGVT